MFDDVEAKEFGGVENAVHTGHIGIKDTIKRINSVKVNITSDIVFLEIYRVTIQVIHNLMLTPKQRSR